MMGMTMLGIAFCSFFIYITYLKMKREELSQGEAAFWFIIWVGLIILALFPKLFGYIAVVLNISRPIDVLLTLGILSMLAMSFYLFLICKRNENAIDKLLEEIK